MLKQKVMRRASLRFLRLIGLRESVDSMISLTASKPCHALYVHVPTVYKSSNTLNNILNNVINIIYDEFNILRSIALTHVLHLFNCYSRVVL